MGVYDSITSPSSFYQGTVVSPAFLNSVKSDLNNLIANHWQYEVVKDHFCGSAVSTAFWSTISGSPTTVDDSSNGGHGCVLLDGTTGMGGGQVIATRPLALSTSDFRLRMRLRTPSMTGTAVHLLGLVKASTSKHLEFYALGSDSTTNWRVYIDGAFTSPNGTAASISSSHQTFEIVRASNVVTFYVNGVALHTISSYTSDLSGAEFTLSATTSGNVRVDVAQMIAGVS